MMRPSRRGAPAAHLEEEVMRRELLTYIRRRELRGELADGTPHSTPMRNGNAECDSPSGG